MLLVYVPRLTNRIGYTLNVLLEYLLHVEFSITTDADYFVSCDGPKLCYAHRKAGDSLFVKSCGLLESTAIEDQAPHAFCQDGQWMIFPVYGKDVDFGFDLLAATFFMVSRYEEYLPHRTDVHGRFESSQSVAAQAGFLQQPVVDQWARMLRLKLGERYPGLSLVNKNYCFVQTVDIDAAWCYRHKRVIRSMAGLGRDMFVRRDHSLVKQRLDVLLHRAPDPYDTFDYILDHWQNKSDTHLIFFALLSDYDHFDKPTNYLNPAMRELLQHLGDYAKVGIHPGYNSLEEPKRFDEEKARLESIMHRTVVRARFHYLRLSLPRSYRILMHAGIKHDYTMGYPDAAGFRAGISVPYPFYDLERDEECGLTIHPFCVMDTTLGRYLLLQPAEGVALFRRLNEAVRDVNGMFCCIFHNQNLSESEGWQGWREAYEQMVALAMP